MKKSNFGAAIKYLICGLIMLGVNEAKGQINANRNNSGMRYGGGIGLSFGNGYFSGSIAPSAIYEFDDQFALGGSLTGAYSSFKDHYTSTIVGGSIIGLYNVIPQIQLSTEFEELNISRKYEYDGGNFKENYWYPGLFLGVGFRSGNFTAGIRYDLLFDREKSMYSDAYVPFVRVYF